MHCYLPISVVRIEPSTSTGLVAAEAAANKVNTTDGEPSQEPDAASVVKADDFDVAIDGVGDESDVCCREQCLIVQTIFRTTFHTQCQGRVHLCWVMVKLC